MVFYLGNHRDAASIENTWRNFIQNTDAEATSNPSVVAADVVMEKVRSLGRRVNGSDIILNPSEYY